MTRSQLRHSVVREDLQAVFANANVEGAFALLVVSTKQLTVVNRVRAERRAVPASTFKIPHAVIALETGAIGDEDEVVPYGGGRQPVKAWERDMSIREAIPLSNAAIFQELARRIGHLARLELPASAKTQQTVKDLLLPERSANAVLYGKTGWQFETDPQLGWWVGWVKRDNAIFAFALNMES